MTMAADVATLSEFALPTIGMRTLYAAWASTCVGQPVLLRPHRDGHRTGVVDVGVEQVGVGRRGDERDAVRVQPGQRLGRRVAGHRHAEHGALGGADEVGVAPVGHRVGGDDGLAPGGVGGAQHGAEVARLLDALAQHA